MLPPCTVHDPALLSLLSTKKANRYLSPCPPS